MSSDTAPESELDLTGDRRNRSALSEGPLICHPLSSGPDGGAGYCEPTIPGVTPSGEALGQIVDDPAGWALATDAGGDRFLAGGNRALGRSTGPIALSRNRFDGTFDRSFGRGGTAIAYYGLEGARSPS